MKRGRFLLALGLLAVLGVVFGRRGLRELPRDEDRNGPYCPRCNVVLIVVDALRADHVGFNGYHRNTTPFLDTLARRGVNFRNTYSQESYTQASVPSLLTSTYPTEHRVLYDRPLIDTLSEESLTIAEVLEAHEYSTAAFVFNPHLQARYNFDQGFDLYDDNPEGFVGRTRAERYETAAKIEVKTRAWLATARDPFFLYLHYRDVHAPYVPMPPYDEMFVTPDIAAVPKSPRYALSQYDGEIAYTDRYLERLVADIERERGPTLFVITADHGEAFMDHGSNGHGWELYEENIKVPLLFYLASYPGGETIEDRVELVDVAPTVLRLVDVPVAESMKGQFLFAGSKKGIVFSGGAFGRGVLIERDKKLYRRVPKNRQRRQPENGQTASFVEEVYDLTKDPRERRNLVTELPDLATDLRAKLAVAEKSSRVLVPRAVEVDPVTEKRMRALGYLQ